MFHEFVFSFGLQHPIWQSWDLSLQHCLSQLWPSLALTISNGNTPPSDGGQASCATAPANRNTSAPKPISANNFNSKQQAKDGGQFLIQPAILQVEP